MIRILLIDDHPVVRAGYRRLLEQESDLRVVAECADADSGYAAFVREQPDLCITDLSLPGASGLDALRRMRARQPDADVLVFSMHDSPHVVRRALQEGARGFVSKNAHLLREAAPCDDQLASLSPREFSVFRLLAEGRSAAQCAELLKLSPKTVANVQTLVKEKLQVSTSAGLVHLALQEGLISNAVMRGAV